MFSVESVVTIVTGVAETGAISFVLFMIFRGLKSQVDGLKKTVDVQSQTIHAMEKRVLETEKISALYRDFIEDYPNTLEQYKSTIVKTKNEIIDELSKRVQDQGNTIVGLQQQVSKLNPDEVKKFERIAGALLTEPLAEFQEFLQKIDGRKELTIYSILRTTTVESFLQANGYTIILEDNLLNKIVEGMGNKNADIQFASVSAEGLSYAFTHDRSVLVTSKGKKALEKQLSELRNMNLTLIST